MKPFLLLDVDGVAFPEGSIHIGDERFDVTPDEPFRRLAFKMGGHLRGSVWDMDVVIAESMVDRIARLMEHFDLAWATMWEDRVMKFLPQIPEWPQNAPIIAVEHHLRESFKHPGIERFILENDHRPFAWVDDEHIPHHWRLADRGVEIENSPPPAHLAAFIIDDDDENDWPRTGPMGFSHAHKFVIPDPAIGMNDEHVDELIEWAKSL